MKSTLPGPADAYFTEQHIARASSAWYKRTSTEVDSGTAGFESEMTTHKHRKGHEGRIWQKSNRLGLLHGVHEHIEEPRQCSASEEGSKCGDIFSRKTTFYKHSRKVDYQTQTRHITD
ncbi:hypothetical protein NX059_009816 [Plenodomus lindquistii]|nr:hypothetical protein NX059_009816 [Plenodomus lindquistii]